MATETSGSKRRLRRLPGRHGLPRSGTVVAGLVALTAVAAAVIALRIVLVDLFQVL
jgi:hypothetical protein